MSRGLLSGGIGGRAGGVMTADVIDGIGSFAVGRVFGVTSDSQQLGQSVCPEAAESLDGCYGCKWSVSVIHETAQVVEG